MKLRIIITPDSNGQYVATCPSLPGCKSRGPTREEAAHRLDEAICGYLAAVSDFVPDQVVHEVVETRG